LPYRTSAYYIHSVVKRVFELIADFGNPRVYCVFEALLSRGVEDIGTL
jgi:hypothetical protein